MGRKKKTVDPDAWIQEYKDRFGWDPVGFKEAALKLPISVKGDGKKRGGIRPLGEVINEAQLAFIESIIDHRRNAILDPDNAGPFREMRLKIRQLASFSTIATAVIRADCAINGDGCDAIITAHQGASLQALSDTLRRYAGEKKGKARVGDQKFRTESGAYINLWSSKDIRSSAAMHALWSEADYVENFNKSYDAFIPAMDKSPHSIVIFETTTKRGEDTEFREFVEQVLNGETEDWVVRFTAWHSLSDRVRPPKQEESKGFDETFTPYESLLRLKFGLSDEQINWHRYIRKTDHRGVLAATQEAYPSTLEEAMMGKGGHQYYFKESLEFLKGAKREPIQRCLLAYDGIRKTDDPREYTDHPHFEQYAEIKSGHRYVIGADGADAEQRKVADEGSECYAVIMDEENGEVVGEFHGNMNLQEFAIGVWQMAKWYNHALIIPEINQAQGVIDHLTDVLGYFNIYEREPLKFGFHTSHGTRPTLVGRLQDNINRMTLIIPSANLMTQLVAFGKRRGRAQKKQARKNQIPDDGCVALALCMMGTENSVNGTWHKKTPSDLDTSIRIDTTESANARRATYAELDIEDLDTEFYDDIRRKRSLWGLT